jgi:hypothetical protein
MIIIVGLVILVAAVVAAVAGVLANSGHAHALTHGFAVFGYHVTGSTGTLFLYGIVIGAVGLAGLSLLLAGARRTSRRGREARRGLKQSQQETAAVAQARDDLIDQRDTARTYTASTLGSGADGTSNGHRPSSGRSLHRLLRRRPAASPESPAQMESPAGRPGSDAPAQVATPATADGSHP